MLGEQRVAGVAVLTLDRPQRGNALSAELVAALRAALARAFDDATVHTVCLAGAGTHFCTGFDLGDLDAQSDGDLLARFVDVELLLAELWHAPVRTVAFARGRAWGAGADLFAACDLRMAAPDTTFRFPGAGFGLVLGSRRLAEQVGADHARRWVAEGMQVDAATAEDAGLVTAITAAGLSAEQHLHALSLPEPAIDRETVMALRRATRADHRDHDLAALVRSAARPGLKARIAAYSLRRKSAS